MRVEANSEFLVAAFAQSHFGGKKMSMRSESTKWLGTKRRGTSSTLDLSGHERYPIGKKVLYIEERNPGFSVFIFSSADDYDSWMVSAGKQTDAPQ